MELNNRSSEWLVPWDRGWFYLYWLILTGSVLRPMINKKNCGALGFRAVTHGILLPIISWQLQTGSLVSWFVRESFVPSCQLPVRFLKFTRDCLVSEGQCAGDGKKTKRNLKGSRTERENEEDEGEHETEELITPDIIWYIRAIYPDGCSDTMVAIFQRVLRGYLIYFTVTGVSW